MTTSAAVAESLLAFVGYRGAIDVPAGALAHVDKRLVEIARALALRPAVLALDEPAAGLDAADTALIDKVLRELAAIGIAIILVEHDMELVMGVSSHVIVLDAGAKIAEGAPREVAASPAVREAYLGAGEQADRGRAAHASRPRRAVADGALALGRLRRRDRGSRRRARSRRRRACRRARRQRRGQDDADARAERIDPADGRRSAFPRAAHRSARRGSHRARGSDPGPGGPAGLSRAQRHRQSCGSALMRADPTTRRRRIEALLERFAALKTRRHQRAGLLSGGEQQMLAIARGLMARPEVLMLDEPSLGLAPKLLEVLYDLLAELREEGTTILLVDQMATLALSVADRAYVLQSGTIKHSGSAREVAGDPALMRAYLGDHGTAR